MKDATYLFFVTFFGEPVLRAISDSNDDEVLHSTR